MPGASVLRNVVLGTLKQSCMEWDDRVIFRIRVCRVLGQRITAVLVQYINKYKGFKGVVTIFLFWVETSCSKQSSGSPRVLCSAHLRGGHQFLQPRAASLQWGLFEKGRHPLH